MSQRLNIETNAVFDITFVEIPQGALPILRLYDEQTGLPVPGTSDQLQGGCYRFTPHAPLTGGVDYSLVPDFGVPYSATMYYVRRYHAVGAGPLLATSYARLGESAGIPLDLDPPGQSCAGFDAIDLIFTVDMDLATLQAPDSIVVTSPGAPPAAVEGTIAQGGDAKHFTWTAGASQTTSGIYNIELTAACQGDDETPLANPGSHYFTVLPV